MRHLLAIALFCLMATVATAQIPELRLGTYVLGDSSAAIIVMGESPGLQIKAWVHPDADSYIGQSGVHSQYIFGLEGDRPVLKFWFEADSYSLAYQITLDANQNIVLTRESDGRKFVFTLQNTAIAPYSPQNPVLTLLERSNPNVPEAERLLRPQDWTRRTVLEGVHLPRPN